MAKGSQKEEFKEHTNRGLRNKIVEQMGGNSEVYLQAFADAKLGIDPKDRARIARRADLFPKKFQRQNRGLGSELIQLAEDDGLAAPREVPPSRELFPDMSDEEPAPSGAPPADGFGGLAEAFSRASDIPRLAAAPRRARR